jgi:hypothetical protein
MPRRRKYTTDEVSALLTEHDGNYAKVAKVLGETVDKIRRRVYRDPKLKSIWVAAGEQGHQPNEAELLTRSSPIEATDGEMLSALQKNGKEAFMNDIAEMLNDPKNIGKLDIFRDFDDSVGQLMGEALKLTQKIAIRQNMSLFEVAEKLRDDIQGGSLDAEEEILRTRLFMQATEQQGKFFDRILHGLDLMLKMTEREKGEKKKKAGFRPLKEKDAEDTKD